MPVSPVGYDFAGTGTSPQLPQPKVTWVSPLSDERRMNHSPVPVRYTARPALPSPSKSAATGRAGGDSAGRNTVRCRGRGPELPDDLTGQGDAPDDVGVSAGGRAGRGRDQERALDPEQAVGPHRDGGKMGGRGGRQDELVDGAGRRDASEATVAGLGEPQVAVRSARDAGRGGV